MFWIRLLKFLHQRFFFQHSCIHSKPFKIWPFIVQLFEINWTISNMNFCVLNLIILSLFKLDLSVSDFFSQSFFTSHLFSSSPPFFLQFNQSNLSSIRFFISIHFLSSYKLYFLLELPFSPCSYLVFTKILNNTILIFIKNC